MAVVQAVAHSHHGSVRCINGEHGGARFEMRIPVYRSVNAATHQVEEPTPMQTTKILVVEDDAGLREALTDTLLLAVQYEVIRCR
ncbi:MAG: hypothetical protein U5L01_00245 [Rheinheimera sp.]|nr:hypothetical protein [Rheinheimera sp.]